jgi:hypothetical protein
MIARSSLAFAAIALAMVLSGCAGLVNAATGGAPSSNPSASQSGCNARSCVVSTVDQTLVGSVAKDESVITGMTCKSATVKHNAGDTWTVHCTASYSDGSKWSGFATIVVSQAKVTWEPTDMISDGSGN